jgi:hypothetical protein
LDRNENPAAIARLPGRGGGGRKGEAVELYGDGRGFHHRRTLGRLAADFTGAYTRPFSGLTLRTPQRGSY